MIYHAKKFCNIRSFPIHYYGTTVLAFPVSAQFPHQMLHTLNEIILESYVSKSIIDKNMLIRYEKFHRIEARYRSVMTTENCESRAAVPIPKGLVLELPFVNFTPF